MATYTDLSSSCDSGDPLTTTLLQGLRDNPIAIAEGNAAADGIQIETAGIATGAVTCGSGGKIEAATQSNTDGDTSSTYLGFAIARQWIGGQRGSGSSSDRSTSALRVTRSGEYTVRLMANGQDGDIRTKTELYVNGSLEAESAGAVTTNLYYQAVVNLTAGDEIYIRNVRTDGNDAGNCNSELLLICDNPLMDIQPQTYHYTDISGGSTQAMVWVAEDNT